MYQNGLQVSDDLHMWFVEWFEHFWEEYASSKQATFDHLQNAIFVLSKLVNILQLGTRLE